ncbi:helix-turn-helix transcriptional regulator [Loigolactobacillus coryniformis]|uniref:HTH cro/C1-type domain-containing protein n=1 Tax=Loigolactobacillus coryniformis subsp. torquens DSM 20004 = KCTC 3535 TaxID=1423822 RepID=A0A2D1KMM9_9LACO|nr:helix-turn-helix transcriptional regulator [Loigolactobacillus coryniformis]ATO43394.1 hypothetical protein LC20004_05495 [Loigolactobacillus coryniformis subsp. torquens DSM 20004 = KCTC 3535]MCL5457601.1 helix-turn-helix transcriptional regulator [Loigolactobacillus coryniformis]MDN5953913.1 helix-turn-helix transcriptional regulator [Loigolactobacillus coryniformis]
MTNIRKNIAANTRFFMDHQKITFTELQAITQFGTTTIESILSGNGARGITIVTLESLASALNVAPGDLVDDWQESEEKN